MRAGLLRGRDGLRCLCNYGRKDVVAKEKVTTCFGKSYVTCAGRLEEVSLSICPVYWLYVQGTGKDCRGSRSVLAVLTTPCLFLNLMSARMAMIMSDLSPCRFKFFFSFTGTYERFRQPKKLLPSFPIPRKRGGGAEGYLFRSLHLHS